MTDANLKDPWLGDPRFDDLSDRAWRVFTGGLMWANRQGTNGAIPQRYLVGLHPDGAGDTEMFELERAGIWETTASGKKFIEWEKQLGQSSAETVEHRKAVNRDKAARARAAIKAKLEKVPSDVPGVGKTRQDQIRPEAFTGGSSETEKEQAKPTPWPVASIPGSDDAGLFDVPVIENSGGNYASR